MSARSPQDSLARIIAALPPKPPMTAERLTVMLEELADLAPSALAAAADRIVRSARYFPTVAEIREQAAEAALQLPSETEALAQIEARIDWNRSGRHGDPPQIHPLVRQALALVGGFYAFRAAEEPGVIRGQFCRFYREARADAIRGAQLHRPALPA